MENCYIPILNWQIDVSSFWGKFRISESLGRGTRKKGNWKGNEAHSLTRKSGNEPRLKKKRLPKHRKENQLNPSQKTWTAKTCEIILDHPKTAMPCHANDRLSRFQARVSLVLDSCIGCWSEKNHTKHEKQLGKQANLNLEAPKKVEGFSGFADHNLRSVTSFSPRGSVRSASVTFPCHLFLSASGVVGLEPVPQLI